jgi:hypothetical protein
MFQETSSKEFEYCIASQVAYKRHIIIIIFTNHEYYKINVSYIDVLLIKYHFTMEGSVRFTKNS